MSQQHQAGDQMDRTQVPQLGDVDREQSPNAQSPTGPQSLGTPQTGTSYGAINDIESQRFQSRGDRGTHLTKQEMEALKNRNAEDQENDSEEAKNNSCFHRMGRKFCMRLGATWQHSVVLLYSGFLMMKVLVSIVNVIFIIFHKGDEPENAGGQFNVPTTGERNLSVTVGKKKNETTHWKMAPYVLGIDLFCDIALIYIGLFQIGRYDWTSEKLKKFVVIAYIVICLAAVICCIITVTTGIWPNRSFSLYYWMAMFNIFGAAIALFATIFAFLVFQYRPRASEEEKRKEQEKAKVAEQEEIEEQAALLMHQEDGTDQRMGSNRNFMFNQNYNQNQGNQMYNQQGDGQSLYHQSPRGQSQSQMGFGHQSRIQNPFSQNQEQPQYQRHPNKNHMQTNEHEETYLRGQNEVPSQNGAPMQQQAAYPSIPGVQSRQQFTQGFQPQNANNNNHDNGPGQQYDWRVNNNMITQMSAPVAVGAENQGSRVSQQVQQLENKVREVNLANEETQDQAESGATMHKQSASQNEDSITLVKGSLIDQ